MSSPGNLRRLRNDKDHISKLPETVLCFILSFLKTKAVVRTSILLTRWKYLWTKVPALDFTKESDSMCLTTIYCSGFSLEQKICFTNFVDKVLFHNDVSYVQRFCLDVNDADEFYVNSWLNAATKREFRELYIKLYSKSYLHISLPPRLLSGDKLVSLKLKGHLTLSPLMSSHLRNLETIHLYNLKFPDDEFMRVLSSCPVLQELHIVSCYCLPKILYVESLTLRSLTIIQEIDELESACFVIKTPNVRYLNLHGTVPQYDIGDMCSLIEAYLNVVYDDGGVADNGRAQKLLKSVSRVETLRLTSESFIDERKLPFFQNLTYLKQDADVVMCELLKCAPKLKSLVIRRFNYEFDFDPISAPKHLPSLESVEVCCMNGEEDISLLAYLLKAASSLKEMKIEMSHPVSGGELSVCKELLSLPRSSAVCQVNVL